MSTTRPATSVESRTGTFVGLCLVLVAAIVLVASVRLESPQATANRRSVEAAVAATEPETWGSRCTSAVTWTWGWDR